MESDRINVRLGVNEDRLSSLPDEIIHQILSRFDTKFAVQTCVLSSRWKLIWKSIPRLDLLSRQFKDLPKFAKFVTHVLSHRNRQAEVSTVKLYFHGAANHREFPPCLFNSPTLKHFALTLPPDSRCVTPKTPWDFPALTTLHLFDTILCSDHRESIDLFSKCVNLENLVIKRFIVMANAFDIITPRLSNLTLTHGKHPRVINVIAPQLENLTVICCRIIKFLKTPLELSSLCYSGYVHPQWFKSCFRSLNEVSVSLSFYGNDKPYDEEYARETINMLQELRSARSLTLSIGIVECLCLSAFPDLLSHLPSPFSNLVYLNIDSGMSSDAYKVKMSTEARNFLLENSPNATFIMQLPELPPTKAMKAKEAREKKRAKLLADIESDMKELQALVEKENMLFLERKQALESRKAAFQNLFAELKLLTKSKMMQSEPERYQNKDVTAGLRTQIRACLGELKGLVNQANEGSIAIFRKKERIKLYLERLPKIQRAKLEERYSRQLEEAETLFVGLDSTCEDVYPYFIKTMEEHVEDNSDNLSTLEDVSSHKLPPASQPTFSSEAIVNIPSSNINPLP
ncbi:F-box domain, cyclin-like protein [Tanacetum coccineum]|uniref:F-box domain, cyclin-like protein n=1 Tax=Tanacetum coccineum TaxID=301880 RepID=A0ABQ4WV71_9ASTR